MSSGALPNGRLYPSWPALEALTQPSQSAWMESTDSQFELDNSGTEGSSFGYAPIEPNQIRLLMLEPSPDHDAPLEGMLMVSNFPVPSLDGWCALSYTWGTNSKEFPGLIIINGRKKLRITANLEMALRDVRSRDAVPYWVDAICINQEDPVEKGHQIRHMRFIYERALAVTVWLDGANSDTDELMRTLQSSHHCSDDEMLHTFAEHDWMNAKLSGLISITQQSYWRRIWVLQELVCGTTVMVHCGQHGVPLDTLFRARELISTAFQNLKRPSASVPALLSALNSSLDMSLIELYRSVRAGVAAKTAPGDSNIAVALWGMLQATRRSEASDPRDRVYAVLGVVKDNQWSPQFFPVDYTLTAEQIYQDVAMWIVVHSEGLYILTGLRSIRPNSPALPSWCPDWGSTVPQINGLLDLSRLKIDMTTGSRKPVVSFGPEKGSMTVTGVSIGRCIVVTGQIDLMHLFWYHHLSFSCTEQLRLRAGYDQRQQTAISRWIGILGMSNPALAISVVVEGEQRALGDFHTQKTLVEGLQERVPGIRQDRGISSHLEKLWRTLVLDFRADEDDTAQAYRAMFNCLCGWQDESISPHLDTKEALLKFTHAFRRRAADCGGGRQLAFTGDGVVASVPLDVQEGDLLCSLFGCLLPTVLRPHGSYYTVVGEAYVNGYMNFEAVRDMEFGSRQQRAFTLH